MVRSFIYKVKRLIKWFRLVWNDVDYDYSSIYNVLEFKIQDIADNISKYKIHTEWRWDLQRLNTCKRLLQRVKNEYYIDEYLDYIKKDWEFVPVEGSTSCTLESTVLVDNLHIYLEKYTKVASIHLMSTDEKEALAIKTAWKRHNKAKKLLFNYINQYIHTWWY